VQRCFHNFINGDTDKNADATNWEISECTQPAHGMAEDCKQWQQTVKAAMLQYADDIKCL